MKNEWIDFRCVCGCGITVRATDPEAQNKIEEWRKNHAKKCKGGKK